MLPGKNAEHFPPYGFSSVVMVWRRAGEAGRFRMPYSVAVVNERADVAKVEAEAMRLYRLAARQGGTDAKKSLSRHGLTVRQDEPHASGTNAISSVFTPRSRSDSSFNTIHRDSAAAHLSGTVVDRYFSSDRSTCPL